MVNKTKRNKMNNASAHKSSPYPVLEAAAIFSRMRDWGRGALPINKMDWLSWVSQLCYLYTALCCTWYRLIAR